MWIPKQGPRYAEVQEDIGALLIICGVHKTEEESTSATRRATKTRLTSDVAVAKERQPAVTKQKRIGISCRAKLQTQKVQFP